MARLHYVARARKAYRQEGIKKGQPYYWWRLWKGAKQRSATRPPRSRLTRSNFYGTLWDTEDDLTKAAESFRNAGMEADGFKDAIEEAAAAIESLGEEQGSNRENMPEQLQDSGTGQLLQDRADACEELAASLRNLADGWEEEPDDAEEPEKESGESEEDFDKRMDAWQAEFEQALSEWRSAVADSIGEVSFDIE